LLSYKITHNLKTNVPDKLYKWARETHRLGAEPPVAGSLRGFRGGASDAVAIIALFFQKTRF